LAATFISFVGLISIISVFSAFVINLQKVEIMATKLTSNWNYLNSQSKRLYYSDEHILDLEKQWHNGLEEVEQSEAELRKLRTNNAELRKTLDNIHSTWKATSHYFDKISTNLNEFKQTSIGEEIISTGGIALHNISILYLQKEYSEQEYFHLANLERSIRVLDTAGSIFNELLSTLKKELLKIREQRIQQYTTISLIAITLVMSLYIIFMTNIIRLNYHMGEIIGSQTRELKTRLEQLELTQNELAESKKREAMLHLITGIAHEINTPLGVGITAQSLLKDYLQNEMERERDIKETMDLLEGNLKKIDILVRTLKEFIVSPDQGKKQTLHLKNIIDTTISDFQDIDKENIHLQIPKETQVYTYPLYLVAAVKPIIQNWYNHGFSSETGFQIISRKNKSHWYLILSDRGGGMSKDTLQSCFEPFYTTQRGSGHIGLGLSLAENIVRQKLDGQIFAFNSPGGGTRIVLKFSHHKETVNDFQTC